MVLKAALLNTQFYKVRIRGKVEQSRKRSKRPSLNLGVVAMEKGAFGSPSTVVAIFFCLDSHVIAIHLFEKVMVIVIANECSNQSSNPG